MGGMGGGMRSVPPTDLPFALLNPGQIRSLPTRLVSVSRPDPDAGLSFPEKGEQLKVGDISQISDNPKVQKALRRLAADKAPTTLSQLVCATWPLVWIGTRLASSRNNGRTAMS